MMPGLLEGQEKMSKSDPNSAIFMEDSESEVASKIKKAFCPPLVSHLKTWTCCRGVSLQLWFIALVLPCHLRCMGKICLLVTFHTARPGVLLLPCCQQTQPPLNSGPPFLASHQTVNIQMCSQLSHKFALVSGVELYLARDLSMRI